MTFTSKTLSLGTVIIFNGCDQQVTVTKVSAKTFEASNGCRYHYTLLARQIESGAWALALDPEQMDAIVAEEAATELAASEPTSGTTYGTAKVSQELIDDLAADRKAKLIARMAELDNEIFDAKAKRAEAEQKVLDAASRLSNDPDPYATTVRLRAREMVQLQNEIEGLRKLYASAAKALTELTEEPADCPECGGRGQLEETATLQSSSGDGYGSHYVYAVDCPACHGSGYLAEAEDEVGPCDHPSHELAPIFGTREEHDRIIAGLRGGYSVQVS